MNLNLCFHGIGTCTREREPGEARYWVEHDVFRGILDLVPSSSSVSLSFDDGNASDVEVALPELTGRGLTATFFALAGRLEDRESLQAADLRDLRAAGMTIGTHGWSHVPWRGLGVEEQRREFVDARAVLAEASGGEIDEAALPLGRYDRKTLHQLRRVGYRAVYTSDRFPARRNARLRARYSVMRDDTVASIGALLRGRPGVAEIRNLAASAVKRLR